MAISRGDPLAKSPHKDPTTGTAPECGPLSNQRHERLAQLVAATGCTYAAAYREVYKPKDPKKACKSIATIRYRFPAIDYRIKTLQRQVADKIVEQAADEGEILAGLRDVIAKCTDENDYRPAQAIRAFELLGKTIGMWENPGDAPEELGKMSSEDLLAEKKRLEKERLRREKEASLAAGEAVASQAPIQ